MWRQQLSLVALSPCLVLACSDPVVEQAGVSVIAPTRAVVSEAGDQNTVDVVLTEAPDADVVIGVAVSDTDEATIDVSQLVFTPANWDQRQTITITGVADQTNNAPTEPDKFTLDFTRVDSDDEAYDGLDLDPIEFTNLDNFVEWELIDVRTGEKPVGLSTAEGEAIEFAVRLLDEPFAEVTLELNLYDSSDGPVVLPPENLSFELSTPDVHALSLTFTPDDYDQMQTFSVHAMEDGGTPDPGKVFNMTVTSTGDKAYEDFFVELATTPEMPLPIFNLDPDSAEVVQTPARLILCEGTVGQVFVQLSSLPLTGDVTVSLDGGGALLSFEQPGKIETMQRLSFNVTSPGDSVNQNMIITGTMTVTTDDSAYLLNYGGGNETRDFEVQIINVDRTNDPDIPQQPIVLPLCPTT